MQNFRKVAQLKITKNQGELYINDMNITESIKLEKLRKYSKLFKNKNKLGSRNVIYEGTC